VNPGGFTSGHRQRSANKKMNIPKFKKMMWIVNGLLTVILLAIIISLWIQQRMTFDHTLTNVAAAIERYEKANGVLPRSLSDLGDKRLTSYRGNPIVLEYQGTNHFTLSVVAGFECPLTGWPN